MTSRVEDPVAGSPSISRVKSVTSSARSRAGCTDIRFSSDMMRSAARSAAGSGITIDYDIKSSNERPRPTTTSLERQFSERRKCAGSQIAARAVGVLLSGDEIARSCAALASDLLLAIADLQTAFCHSTRNFLSLQSSARRSHTGDDHGGDP